MEGIYKKTPNLKNYFEKNFFNEYLSDPKKIYLKQECYKEFYEYIEKGISKTGWKFENLKKFARIDNAKLKKNSMNETYLKKYLKKGGKILENYKCVNIKKLKNNLINLKLLKKNKELHLKSKNVIICCGAPYSLQLLKQSKLVPNSLNNNFHFHPMIKLIAKYDSEINPKQSGDVLNTQIVEFYPKYIFGNAASGEQFLKISTFGNREAYLDVKKNFRNMAIYHSTFSFSSASLKFIPFLNEHIIFNKFSLVQKKIISEGIENLIKFVFNTGANYIYLGDEKSTKIQRDQIDNVPEILKNINLNISAVHLLGGLSMGDDDSSPLEIYGKLKGSSHGIYVNDSTLLTNHLLKNPQSTVMHVANINSKNFIKNANF